MIDTTERPTTTGVAAGPVELHERPVQLAVNGGRVLCVTALGDSVKQAQVRAYEMLKPIHFDGAQYRSDIGHRAIKR